MKRLCWSFLGLALVGCTGVIEDVGAEQAEADEPELMPGEFVQTTTCEVSDVADDQADADLPSPDFLALTRPSGYGILTGDGSRRCTTWAAPTRCVVADDKTLKFKVNITTPSYLPANLLKNAFAFAVASIDPQVNWTVNISGTQSSESANTSTASELLTHCKSSTAIGCSAWTLDTQFTDGGLPYTKSKRCSIYVDPDNVAWSSDPTEQLWQAFNIYSHEIGHCLGLGHSSSGLMRAAGAAETKTALSYDASDIQNINNYQP